MDKFLKYYLLSGVNKIGLPTLANLIKIIITTPFNSKFREKCFSSLRRLKSYLQTAIG